MVRPLLGEIVGVLSEGRIIRNDANITSLRQFMGVLQRCTSAQAGGLILATVGGLMQAEHGRSPVL